MKKTLAGLMAWGTLLVGTPANGQVKKAPPQSQPAKPSPAAKPPTKADFTYRILFKTGDKVDGHVIDSFRPYLASSMSSSDFRAHIGLADSGTAFYYACFLPENGNFCEHGGVFGGGKFVAANDGRVVNLAISPSGQLIYRFGTGLVNDNTFKDSSERSERGGNSFQGSNYAVNTQGAVVTTGGGAVSLLTNRQGDWVSSPKISSPGNGSGAEDVSIAMNDAGDVAYVCTETPRTSVVSPFEASICLNGKVVAKSVKWMFEFRPPIIHVSPQGLVSFTTEAPGCLEVVGGPKLDSKSKVWPVLAINDLGTLVGDDGQVLATEWGAGPLRQIRPPVDGKIAAVALNNKNQVLLAVYDDPLLFERDRKKRTEYLILATPTW